MNKTLITADSTCYIPPELVPEEVPVIQAEVKTKNGRFRESYEITSENIIEYAKRERKAPELIYPSEEEYEAFFAKHLKKASSICHLCCAANSGSQIQKRLCGGFQTGRRRHAVPDGTGGKACFRRLFPRVYHKEHRRA